MPVILETISWILKNVNVGVDRLIVGYGVRFVYSVASWAKFKSKFVPVQAHALETSCFTRPNHSLTHAAFVIIWAQSETW